MLNIRIVLFLKHIMTPLNVFSQCIALFSGPIPLMDIEYNLRLILIFGPVIVSLIIKIYFVLYWMSNSDEWSERIRPHVVLRQR